MATADDTARARPKLHPRAKTHALTDTPVHKPTMPEVRLAAQAIVRVMLEGVAARDPHDPHSKNVLKNPWWRHNRTIEGLSVALSILHEQGDALLRRKRKGEASA